MLEYKSVELLNLKKQKNFFSISVLFLTFLFFISGVPFLYLFIFQIVVLMPMLFFKRKSIFKKKYFDFVLILLFILSLVVSIYNSDYRPLFLPIYLYYSYVFSEYLIEVEDFSKVVFYILLLYIVWFIISGISSGFSPSDINDYMIGRSRNSVSWFVICISIIYYASVLIENRKLDISCAFISFIICFICFGRSGLLISFLLLSLVCFLRLDQSSYIYKVLLILASFLVLCALFYYLDYIFEFIETKTNFSKGIESPRSIINKEYLSNMDTSGIFWGYDPNKIDMVVTLDGNVHNSYIYFHSRSGFAMLFFFFAIFISIFKYMNTKYFWFIMSLIMLFIIRISVDIVAFPGPFDFVIFYLILSLRKINNITKQKV